MACVFFPEYRHVGVGVCNNNDICLTILAFSETHTWDKICLEIRQHRSKFMKDIPRYSVRSLFKNTTSCPYGGDTSLYCHNVWPASWAVIMHYVPLWSFMKEAHPQLFLCISYHIHMDGKSNALAFVAACTPRGPHALPLYKIRRSLIIQDNAWSWSTFPQWTAHTSLRPDATRQQKSISHSSHSIAAFVYAYE